jgi:hypothetical protein
MCDCVKTQHITAGWGCHHCRVYNGLQRTVCRHCGKVRCTPLRPDIDSGEHFETYDEAYKDDPRKLAAIKAQLAD